MSHYLSDPIILLLISSQQPVNSVFEQIQHHATNSVGLLIFLMYIFYRVLEDTRFQLLTITIIISPSSEHFPELLELLESPELGAAFQGHVGMDGDRGDGI